MGKHVFLSVLGFTLVAIVVGIFILPGQEARNAKMPWQIELTPDGGSRVLGVELGKTPLGEVEYNFGEPAEVSMFVPEQGAKVVEAYFDSVDLNGIRAKVVLVLQLDTEQLEAMYADGVRLANMGGGRRKVTLSDADLEKLKGFPAMSMTYIPRANLDEEIVLNRFGEPAERVAEPEGKTVHWLYPDKGLDVAIKAEEKEVLQYVRPDQFDFIRAPLMELGAQADESLVPEGEAAAN